MPESPNGRVITFYSYKGGTGRSMALANLAFALAKRNGGKRVLAVDWDLEAPGLHRYFRPYIKNADINERPGLIEILASLRELLGAQKKELEREELGSIVAKADWDAHTLATDLPSLDFIKAGRFDASYSERINTFGWEDLYQRQPNFFGAIADHLSQRYAYVLVDSRTGLTDISGICTALIPDTIVAVFTPNRQSIDGAVQILRQAVDYRKQSDDLRTLRIFPLASRIELNEKKLQEAWRFGDREGLKGYQAEFEDLFNELYGLEECDLKAYFNDAQIQYVPFYSFGEEVAVRSEVESSLSLARSYTSFEEILSAPQNPWEHTSARVTPWDDAWFETQKKTALESLEKTRLVGYMEVRCSLAYPILPKARLELRDAASKAFLPSHSGSHIGIVDAAGESKPRPSDDGIVAEVSERAGTYNYWSLRSNGDFFLLRSLIEDDFLKYPSRIIAIDARIAEVTEVLLYCQRLYKQLGVSPLSQARIIVEHSGLKGRSLRPGSVALVDRSVTSIRTSLNGIEEDLVGLVRTVAAPMFELFDFMTFPESVYIDHVERVRSRS